MTPEAAVEAAVNARGRAHNPKWDHPIFGYKTFSEDQKEHLRAEARAELESAAPLMAIAWDAGAESAWSRSTPVVNGQNYQWRHEGEPLNPYRPTK